MLDAIAGPPSRDSMATTYGYVIFKFQVFPGQKRTAIDFQDAEGHHYLDVLLEDLKTLRDRGALGENPDADDEDDDAGEETSTTGKSTRLTRVESVEERGWTVSFEARYGRIGSHDVAMPNEAGGEDIILAQHAPSRPHRGLFLVPPTGSTGLVAIEVIGKSQPLPLLLRWLKNVSKVPWRVKAAKSSDEEAFLQALRASHDMVVDFEKVQPGEDNTPGSRRMKVHAPVVTATARGDVRDRVLGWVTRRDRQLLDPTRREPLDPGAEARDLATIVDGELRELSFDDARVVIEDSDGVKRVFRPELKFTLYTYYLDDDRPTDEVFYSQVRASMRRQFSSTEIEMPSNWHATRD